MLSLLVTATLLAATPFEERFGKGGAELSSYTLTQPRYGQSRAGEAVMVWVTEPFSKSKQVKVDDWTKNQSDQVNVLKLNLVKRFTTGVYDYALMSSVFVPTTAPQQHPIKVAVSSQEWCGNVFHQLNGKDGGYREQWNSYFESEGDQQRDLLLDKARPTLLGDELFFRVRELVEPFKPGSYSFIPSLEWSRLSHRGDALKGVLSVTRAAKSEKLKVPAGEFETTRFDFALEPQKPGALQRWSIWVEAALPHRIIAWEGDVPGFLGNEPTRERGELKGSLRDEYWKHNRVADEPLRKKLNLLH